MAVEDVEILAVRQLVQPLHQALFQGLPIGPDRATAFREMRERGRQPVLQDASLARDARLQVVCHHGLQIRVERVSYCMGARGEPALRIADVAAPGVGVDGVGERMRLAVRALQYRRDDALLAVPGQQRDLFASVELCWGWFVVLL